MGPIGATLGWSRPSNTSAAKPFPWYLVVTARSERSGFVGCTDQKHPQFSWNLDDCAIVVQKIYPLGMDVI